MMRPLYFAAFFLVVIFFCSPVIICQEYLFSDTSGPDDSAPFGYPGEINIHRREAYTFSWNPELNVADWLCYRLEPDDLDESIARKDRFKRDPFLPRGQGAFKSDYTNKANYVYDEIRRKLIGYQMGHLMPADDCKQNSIVMEECFYLTNIVPQNRTLNTGIWNTLEEHVHKFVTEGNSANICAGPIFIDDDEDGIADYETIGKKNMIAVPEKLFKVVVWEENGSVRAEAYIMPNFKPDDRSLKGLSYRDFQVSIDEVEEFTGLDFLNELPDKTENRIEAEIPE